MSAESVGDIIGLYEDHGTERYDEAVTQLAHALQCAALATAEGAGDALVVAGLLHDVGHLIHVRDGGAPADADLRHEDTGAAWLRPLLPPEVTAPIALHVRAKRYLCAVDPGYLGLLSAGSMRSLALQGGPMGAAEARRFEAVAGYADAVRVRRWDDDAKVPDLDVHGIESYAGTLHRLVRA
jgi:phosphonate degradation associated HDIG domain protein